MAFAREIVESQDAQKVIDNHIAHDPKLTDFWEGFKWFLARAPERGYRVRKTDPPTYVIHFYHWNRAGIVAAYRFDDDQVEVLDLQIFPFR